MHNKILNKVGKILRLDIRCYIKNFSYMFANNIITIIFAITIIINLYLKASSDILIGFLTSTLYRVKRCSH